MLLQQSCAHAGGRSRKPCPGDLTEQEWVFVAPDLTLMREEALQREHSLREVSKPRTQAVS